MKLFQKTRSAIAAVRSRSLLMKVLLNKYTVATIVFILCTFILDRNNIFTLFSTRRQLSDQYRQELFYRQSIKNANEKIQQLTKDRDTIEMFARENYLFLEDGETVYLIDTE